MTDTEKYSGSKIQVLKGLLAVQKNPGMYIGDVESYSGLHHMFIEILDNCLDEALAGRCDTIEVELLAENTISIKDNGAGMPVYFIEEEGLMAPEVILTTLHAGGKFNEDNYAFSGGLHGVGSSVVNALS